MVYCILNSSNIGGMMYRYIITFGVCILLILGLNSTGRCQIKECRHSYSIDYVVTWSPYFNACDQEMKTTLDYEIAYPGAYKVLMCTVDNTPFQEEYWAAAICPNPDPVCTGTITDWTHLTNMEDLRMQMDIIPIIGDYSGFNEHVFSVYFYASQPD